MLSLQQLKNLKNSQEPKETKGLLESLPSIVGYILILSSVYGILKLHFFYKTCLKIPIFQYLEISEIVLFAPSVVAFICFYVTVMFLFTAVSNGLIKSRFKWIYLCLIVFAATSFLFGSVLTDPNVSSSSQFYLQILLAYIPFIIYMIYVFIKLWEGKVRLFRINKNIFIYLPAVLILWKATYDSFYENYVLKSTPHYQELRLKLVDGSNVISTSKFKFISRTKNNWFFYDLNRTVTRIIDNSDVKVAEFQSTATQLKSHVTIYIEVDTINGTKKIIKKDSISY